MLDARRVLIASPLIPDLSTQCAGLDLLRTTHVHSVLGTELIEYIYDWYG